MTTHIVPDLETMGLPPNGAIIAIGAVAVDPDLDEPIVGRFYTQIRLDSAVDAGLVITPSTVMWWLQQSDDARKAFADQADRKKLENVPTLRGALLDYAEFVKFYRTEDGGIYGNGSLFDNNLLNTAFELTKVEKTWPYWADKCYRTIKDLRPNIKLDRVGVYHNALGDAESQGLHLVKLLRDINHAKQKT